MCLNNWTSAGYVNKQDIEDTASLPDVKEEDSDDDDDRYLF